MAFINPITKIIDTLTGIRNNTVGGVAAGALAVKEITDQMDRLMGTNLGYFQYADYPTLADFMSAFIYTFIANKDKYNYKTVVGWCDWGGYSQVHFSVSCHCLERDENTYINGNLWLDKAVYRFYKIGPTVRVFKIYGENDTVGSLHALVNDDLDGNIVSASVVKEIYDRLIIHDVTETETSTKGSSVAEIIGNLNTQSTYTLSTFKPLSDYPFQKDGYWHLTINKNHDDSNHADIRLTYCVSVSSQIRDIRAFIGRCEQDTKVMKWSELRVGYKSNLTSKVEFNSEYCYRQAGTVMEHDGRISIGMCVKVIKEIPKGETILTLKDYYGDAFNFPFDAFGIITHEGENQSITGTSTGILKKNGELWCQSPLPIGFHFIHIETFK